MTQREKAMIEAIDSGKFVAVGVMHSSKLEIVSVRDSKSPGGARRAAYVTREIVITAAEPVVIGRWLKDDEKPDDWKPSAPKNTEVLVVVGGKLETANGVSVLQGEIRPLV